MLVWPIPTVGLLVSSFRPPDELSTVGLVDVRSARRTDFTVQNYQDVLDQNGIGQAFINSLFIAIPATDHPDLRRRVRRVRVQLDEFPGRDVLFVVVVGLLVVPLQTTLIPILRLFARWGITGEFLAVWLAHTGYGLPFAVYLLRNFMGSLPRVGLRVGRDGRRHHVTAFFRIAVPMSVPAFAALAIFQFPVGRTSSDVLDTAFALQLCEAGTCWCRERASSRRAGEPRP